jgi:Tho1/MOS11 C-terminal domain
MPDSALAAATYKLDLPTSIVDDELKKRQARAARIGIASDEIGAAQTKSKDTEAQPALERAKRFDTGQTAMDKFDEALPMQREKGDRKRVTEGSAMDDLMLKGGRGGGKRFRGGSGGGRPNDGGGRTAIVEKGSRASRSVSRRS